MWDIIGKLAVLVGLLAGLRALYVQLIKPRTLGAKLQKVLEMITEWFDEIDCNVEKGVDFASLNNKERKIHEYIDANLKDYWIKPNDSMIAKWNRRMGIKRELQDSHDLFQKFSRIPASGFPLDGFFTSLIGEFLRFNQNYHKTPPGDYNYADVEMRVKFLRFYVRELGYDG